MKILFTGMTSGHCTKPLNVTFFGLLSDAVSEFAEVTWAAPKLSWTREDLDRFDLVVFGFTPPTALSANKIYGAMHVLNIMFDSTKLRLVVDSQQVWQYKNSIEAVRRDFSMLFSSFYAKRRDYRLAQSDTNKKSIESAASHFISEVWPTIYYPELPWNSSTSSSSALGFGSASRMFGINLDSLVLLTEPQGGSARSNLWAVDSLKSSWYKTLEPSLRFEAVEARPSRHMNDAHSSNVIRASTGLIIPPQERKTGTWWSYRYAQGLNTNTPIVTSWQESYKLDRSWAYLAYQLEDMSESERIKVAADQLGSYEAAIDSKKTVINKIKHNMIDSPKERI